MTWTEDDNRKLLLEFAEWLDTQDDSIYADDKNALITRFLTKRIEKQ